MREVAYLLEGKGFTFWQVVWSVAELANVGEARSGAKEVKVNSEAGG